MAVGLSNAETLQSDFVLGASLIPLIAAPGLGVFVTQVAIIAAAQRAGAFGLPRLCEKQRSSMRDRAGFERLEV